MSKPTEYIIAECANKGAVATLVRNLMQEGWVCQGGVAITLNGLGATIYAQAMVKST